MSAGTFSREQINSLLQMDDDQLYSSLVPPDEKAELYQQGALVARGKSAFLQIFRSVREPVCHAYLAQKDKVNQTVDLVALIAVAMLGGGVTESSAVKAAILAVRIGLSGLCQGQQDT